MNKREPIRETKAKRCHKCGRRRVVWNFPEENMNLRWDCLAVYALTGNKEPNSKI